MYKYKKLMVGLDFTDMDKTLVSYTSFLCQTIAAEKIYFFHVEREIDLPQEVLDELATPDIAKDEYYETQMRQFVEENFNQHYKYDIEYDVVEGNPTKEMLRWANIKDVDLIVLGRKSKMKGSGVAPISVAQKVACSVLLVPEQPEYKIDKIFLPTDFSDNAKLALEEAENFINSNNTAKVNMHHVFHLPSGYYMAGKSDEEFDAIMRENKQKEYDEFVAKFGHLEIDFAMSRDSHDLPADALYEKAKESNADIIMVGARGRTAASALLLGSLTEKLIKTIDSIPLLLVKKKNDSFSLWEAIKNL